MVPQVLFLGNGINRAFGGKSWNNILELISTKEYKNRRLDGVPMPLQAILRSNNTIDKKLKNIAKNLFGNINMEDHFRILQKILEVGFDSILTTNYSYELELAGLNKNTISKYELNKLITKNKAKDSAKYALHTYNKICFNKVTNKIYHVHGEARKPSSMVLGHYYYGNLLYRIKQYVDKKRSAYLKGQRDETFVSKSWIDEFILGDIYVLGFGFDLSEIDIWWLLERKNREKAECGKIYFFEPKYSNESYQKELLSVYNKVVEIVDLGFSIDTDDESKNITIYKRFYTNALNKIDNIIKNKRS